MVSGQMSNATVFSALMDFVNRTDQKRTPRRLGYILTTTSATAGASAQPMGACDFVAVIRKPALGGGQFSVCRDNVFKIDVEETKKVSKIPAGVIVFLTMVLHGPCARFARLWTRKGIRPRLCTIWRVLGLVGPPPKALEGGRESLTGSTHKTFFGQRGVIGVNYTEDEPEVRPLEGDSDAFPGAVSNHHLARCWGS